MAALLALVVASIASAPAHSASCAFVWSRTYLGAGAVDERALAVAHDSAGNPIVVGYADATALAQGNDWLIKKYNLLNGNELFSQTYNFSSVPGQSDDRATAIAVDLFSGNFYVAGYVDGSSEGTDKNWMVQRYNPAGVLQWSRTQSCELNGAPPYPPGKFDDDRALGVAVDPGGNAIVAGYETNIWSDFKNIVVRKYDGAGNLLWTASHAGVAGGDDAGNAVCTDSSGNIIVVGYETGADSFDAIIIKYDPAGGPIWNDAWSSVGVLKNEELLGVGVDASGSIYAAGYTHDISDDTLLIKYDSAGNRLWLDTVDGSSGGDDRLNAVSVRPDGIFAAGGYSRRADLGQGLNWVFGKYDSGGNQVWSDTYDSPANADDGVGGIGLAVAGTATIMTVAGYETRTDRGQGEDWRVFRYADKFSCPTARLTPSRNQVLPGDEFTVILSVINGGEGPFTGVSATLVAVSGSASVERVSGPVPTVVPTLAGLSTINFTWTWRAIGPGAVNFSATATGASTTKVRASAGITVVAAAPIPQISPGTMGTDFWLAFMLDDAVPTPDEYAILVTGPAGATIKAEVPGIPFTSTVVMPAGGSMRIKVADAAGINSSGFVENRGVHVTSSADIAVYGFDCHSCVKDVGNWSSDGTLVLPTAAWGCEYLVLGYGQPSNPQTQLAVLASQTGTVVTIIPSALVAGHAKGVPFTVNLDQGQAYRLVLASGVDDLAGTVITATNPVAVFGGAAKTGVPFSTDINLDGNHLYEQMLPTKYWGTRFITVPMAGRRLGDTFMMVASADNTGVSVSGSAPFVLDRGETREMIISGPAEITADQPLAVAQYANSYIYDYQPGDPAMTLVPSVDQFVPDAWLPSISSTLFSANYVSVVVPTTAAGSIAVNGANVSATCFTAVGSSGYSGGALWVNPAVRQHVTGSAPFGLQAYGFFQSGFKADAYAWTGPLALAARSRLTLDGPDSAIRWQNSLFTISWMNREVHSADFVIWDSLPAGTSLVMASAGGTLYGGTVAWTVNGVPAGGVGSVTFEVRTTSSTTSLRQQASAVYATSAAPCPISLVSNVIIVPVSAPNPAPVKVYPNPFNPAKAVNGAIKFRGIKVGGKLHIFTVSGRLVWEAVAGVDPVEWNGKNTGGDKVAPGIYLWVAEGELGKERGKIFLQR